jgi:hypothetical protein
MRLGFGDCVFAEMKNACGEHGICAALIQHIGEVLEFASASAGNHRYSNGLRDGAREF